MMSMKDKPSDDYIESLFETAKKEGVTIDMSKLHKHESNWNIIRIFIFLVIIYGVSALFIKSIIYKNICIVVLTSFIIFCYKFGFWDFRFKSKLHKGVMKNVTKPPKL